MASIKVEYPSLSDSAVTALRPFVSTCLCGSACSTLTAKHRSCISNIETVLGPALTNIEQRLDLVCRRKQSHPSAITLLKCVCFFVFVSNTLLKYKLVGIAGINSSDDQAVRASTSGVVNLSLILSRVKPMTFPWYSQLPCLTLSIKGTVWRASRQVLLCRW